MFIHMLETLVVIEIIFFVCSTILVVLVNGLDDILINDELNSDFWEILWQIINYMFILNMLSTILVFTVSMISLALSIWK